MGAFKVNTVFRRGDHSFDTLRERFRWQIPEYYNIGVDTLDRHASYPGRPALITEDPNGESRIWSFGELIDASNRFANGLHALGVQRGDRVGIVLPQRAETVIAHIAIYKLGAIALPLSVLFGADALSYRLNDSGAVAVITDHSRYDQLVSLRDDLPNLRVLIDCDAVNNGFWELLQRASASFEPVRTRADDPALLIYTSGTTGPPKGALNAHRCLLGNLPGFELSHNFYPQPDDVMWTPADWAWTGGLLDALIPALRYGVPVLGTNTGRYDPERSLVLLQKHRIRNGFIPPTALKMMMQVAGVHTRFSLHLRSIMAAGEQLGAEVLHWAVETLGVQINEMWGQTEFNYLVGNCSAILAVKPGSMGKPYPGHNISPIDDQGQPLPPNQTGELAAHCDDPVMFLGYWQREEATREKISGDWFRTGDLGYMDEDGYFWFVGRKDDVISSAGHRIGPGDIEDCLLQHPAVAQAAVVGSPDPLRGEIIKAFIVPSAGYVSSPELIQDIQHRVRSRLAAHEYPREVEFIDALPITTTGKVRRIELRQREQQRYKRKQSSQQSEC